jgi:hypothetical protein
MRYVLVAILFGAVGCASDPLLASADWTRSPSGGPQSLFALAYALRAHGGWAIETISSDNELHCSQALHVDSAGLSLTFTDPAYDQRGSVPIVDVLESGVANANLDLGGEIYTGGTLTITEVSPTIQATFNATNSNATLTGNFNASICDL